MSLIHYEHFDLYGTSMGALLLRPGYSQFGSMNIETGGDARTGTHGLRLSQTAVGRLLMFTFPSIGDGVGLGQGVALKVGTPSVTVSAVSHGISFGTEANQSLVRVVVNNNNGVSVFLAGTLLGHSDINLYPTGSWFWLEAKVLPGAGSGSVEVRMNGETILNFTGLTITGPFTRSALGSIAPGNNNATGTVSFDDWVVWTTAGSDINDFMGDTFVIVAAPTADSTPMDWAASTGTSRFAMIDEASPSDTDYIQAGTIGDAAEFTHPAFNLGVGSIAAIASQTRAFKADAGAASYATGLSSNGSTSMSSEIALATGSVVHTHIAARNPDGNVPWTQAAANAARLRVERAA